MVSAVVIGFLEPDIHGEKLIYPIATWICGGTILGLLYVMNPPINYVNPDQQRVYMIKQKKIVVAFIGVLIVIIYFGFLIGNVWTLTSVNLALAPSIAQICLLFFF